MNVTVKKCLSGFKLAIPYIVGAAAGVGTYCLTKNLGVSAAAAGAGTAMTGLCCMLSEVNGGMRYRAAMGIGAAFLALGMTTLMFDEAMKADNRATAAHVARQQTPNQPAIR